MKKLKPPRLVTVAIFTTITVVFWVFLSLYRILTASPAADIPPEILAPITPNLNSEALRSLGNRVFFEEQDIEALTTPLLKIIPTPEIPVEPTATPFPTPTETSG